MTGFKTTQNVKCLNLKKVYAEKRKRSSEEGNVSQGMTFRFQFTIQKIQRVTNSCEICIKEAFQLVPQDPFNFLADTCLLLLAIILLLYV